MLSACNEQEHGSLIGAPKVKRIFMRALASFSPCFELNLFTNNVTEAFVELKSMFGRPVYMQAPQEMNVPPWKLLKVIKPL